MLPPLIQQKINEDARKLTIKRVIISLLVCGFILGGMKAYKYFTEIRPQQIEAQLTKEYDAAMAQAASELNIKAKDYTNLFINYDIFQREDAVKTAEDTIRKAREATLDYYNFSIARLNQWCLETNVGEYTCEKHVIFHNYLHRLTQQQIDAIEKEVMFLCNNQKQWIYQNKGLSFSSDHLLEQYIELRNLRLKSFDTLLQFHKESQDKSIYEKASIIQKSIASQPTADSMTQ
jgi:hypothetical protein